ncbi:MAG: CarD family transcriptional regulator [Clostridiales bacterium]|nr:CarD family transcriptional regulator [Clostridiales bacterium]
MFQIGDKVVHPMHGAGIVESIVQKEVNGVTREYYILKLPVRSMVVMVPTEHSGEIGVRPVVGSAEADLILASISQLPVEAVSSWNRRYRMNMERMKSGNLFEVARVVKSLTLRENDRGLSTGERKMLHAAKQILISELVMSKDSSYEDMEEQINIALG